LIHSGKGSVCLSCIHVLPIYIQAARKFMALHDDPRSGFTGKWTSGIFMALATCLWGGASLLAGKFTMPRRRGGFTFEGSPAVLLSLALIAFGFYLHFHYFWGTNPKADHISTPGERVAGFIAVGCLIAGVGLHFVGVSK
jgi:hypothetical protein